MSDNLARRIRSLQILDDLNQLAQMGVPVESNADPNFQLMLESYRYQARAGEFDFIDQFIDPDAVSVDVGANFGQYAVKLAASCRKCIVIEPIQELDWLDEALPPNCLFFNVALGDAQGSAALAIPIRNGEKAFSLATLGSYFENEETVEQIAAVRTLDSLLAECCAQERVGFIKIDVEGHESAVLRGAAKTLQRWRPNIQVEIWQDAVAQTARLLSDFGYHGGFFYDGRFFDISCHDPDLHNAPQNAWRADAPERYDPNMYVNNFFFVTAR